MKVLITGATGRIGQALLTYRPDSADIEMLYMPGEPKLSGYAWYAADIADAKKTVMAVTCSEPDIVVHCAAMTDVDECEAQPEKAFEINGAGTAHIAEACAECGAKLVYVSTDYVFDGVSGPYTENDMPNPVNVYGRSKLEGEKNVYSDNSYNPLIFRISVPFGERIGNTGHNFYSWLTDRLGRNETVRITDDQFTTPAYFGECARVLWSLVQADIGGIVHYGTSDRLSRYNMALDICEVMGFSAELVLPVKTADLGFRAARPLESGFDTGKVSGLLGFRPVTFKEALLKIADRPIN